jgi:uncharacterized caspase-like protein
MIWALLVGINRYRDPRIRPLEYATADARLVKEYLAFECHDAQIERLTDAEATRAAITTAVEALIAKVRLGDRLLFYFAGHGTIGATDAQSDVKAYLAPHDASPTQIERTGYELLIDLPGLLRPVRNRGGRLLMIVDACFRATGDEGSRAFRSVTPEAGNHLELEVERVSSYQRMSIDKSDVLLAATQTNAVAYERHEYGHGAFTHHLIHHARAMAEVGPVRVQPLVDRVAVETQALQTPLYNSWNATNARFPSRHDPR